MRKVLIVALGMTSAGLFVDSANAMTRQQGIQKCRQMLMNSPGELNIFKGGAFWCSYTDSNGAEHGIDGGTSGHPRPPKEFFGPGAAPTNGLRANTPAVPVKPPSTPPTTTSTKPPKTAASPGGLAGAVGNVFHAPSSLSTYKKFNAN